MVTELELSVVLLTLPGTNVSKREVRLPGLNAVVAPRLKTVHQHNHPAPLWNPDLLWNSEVLLFQHETFSLNREAMATLSRGRETMAMRSIRSIKATE